MLPFVLSLLVLLLLSLELLILLLRLLSLTPHHCPCLLQQKLLLLLSHEAAAAAAGEQYAPRERVDARGKLLLQQTNVSFCRFFDDQLYHYAAAARDYDVLLLLFDLSCAHSVNGPLLLLKYLLLLQKHLLLVQKHLLPLQEHLLLLFEVGLLWLVLLLLDVLLSVAQSTPLLSSGRKGVPAL